MRVLIRSLKRGGQPIDRELTTDRLGIGRSEDQDIRVSSPRTEFRHAVIAQGEDGEIRILTNTPLGFLHNGKTATEARITPGDSIEIGNIKLAVREPMDGFDVSMELEETRISQAKELENALLARCKLEFEHPGPRIRVWSWRLTLLILFLLFLIPLAGFVSKPIAEKIRLIPFISDLAWNSGPISRSHQAFGNNCNLCHETAFVSVRDSACANCHKAMPHHIEAGVKSLKDFPAPRCATCHKEHTNKQTFIPHDEGLCTDCHRQTNHQSKGSVSLNASNFGEKHPEFKATLIGFDNGKETSARVSLQNKAELKEDSNLEFSHKGHLDEHGIRSPTRGIVHLECGNCHRLEKDGRYMAPVKFEAHCHECHSLTFEAWDPKREVPHGDVDAAQAFLQKFYADRVINGNFQAFAALGEAETASHIRRPGDSGAEANDWTFNYPQGVTAELFRYRGCGGCHRVGRDSIVADPSQPTWKIQPVRLASRWFPKARFSHTGHQSMQCADCHDAKASEKNADVLIKGIASCRQCHGSNDANGKVASTCIDCHGFHISSSLTLSGEKREPNKTELDRKRAASETPRDSLEQ